MVRRNPLSFLLTAFTASYMSTYEENWPLINASPIVDKKPAFPISIIKLVKTTITPVIIENKPENSKDKVLDSFIDLLSDNLRSDQELDEEDREIIQKTDPEIIMALIELMLYSSAKKWTLCTSILLLENSPEIKIASMSKVAAAMKMLRVKGFYRSELLNMNLLMTLSKSILFYPFIIMLPLSEEERTMIAGDDSSKMLLECLKKVKQNTKEIISVGNTIKKEAEKKQIIRNPKKLQNAMQEIFEKNK